MVRTLSHFYRFYSQRLDFAMLICFLFFFRMCNSGSYVGFCTDEVQKRNEVIRVLTQRLLVVESREEEVKGELSAARQQLSDLKQKQQCISQKCEGIEVIKLLNY